MSSDRQAVVLGALRIQVLSNTLVRIEEKGPRGFEDRATFNVLDRAGETVEVEPGETRAGHVLRTRCWKIVVARKARSLADVKVLSLADALLFDGAAPVPSRAFLPAP